MTPAQISSLLNRQAEQVCRYLFPNGKRQHGEWVCGDVQGNTGQSFKIVIEGDKSGVGCDFATGETFGDLLDVWCAAQHIGLSEAMAQACSYLGIVEDGVSSRPKKEYRRPNRPHTVKRLSATGKVYAYLKLRGLTDQCLEDFRIAEDGDWIVFPYLRNNDLINIKYLHVERTQDGKKQIRQESQAEPCLFGWQAFDSRYAASRFVCLTEGEIDAATLHQCGLPALSVPHGGGGGKKQDWIEAEYDALNRFDTIYLCLDNDEQGMLATNEIIKRIGPERCRIMQLPHKDANECFKNGIKDFKPYLLSAKILDPEELKAADYFTNAVLDKFYPKPCSYIGMRTPFKSINDHLRFRKPELVMWTGYTSSGKSVLLNQIMLQGLMDGERFACASMEMPSKITLWRLMRQITGEANPKQDRVHAGMKWLRDKLWMIDILKTVKPERLLELFVYAYRRYGINNFIIDSLLKCGIAEKDLDQQKEFINTLIDFVNTTESTIHLVAHARKGEDMSRSPGLSDVRGSSALTDLSHTVISVWRNRKDDESQPQEYRKKKTETPQFDASMKVEKQRETGWEGKILLHFDEESLQFREYRCDPPKDYLSLIENGDTYYV